MPGYPMFTSITIEAYAYHTCSRAISSSTEQHQVYCWRGTLAVVVWIGAVPRSSGGVVARAHNSGLWP